MCQVFDPSVGAKSLSATPVELQSAQAIENCSFLQKPPIPHMEASQATKLSEAVHLFKIVPQYSGFNIILLHQAQSCLKASEMVTIACFLLSGTAFTNAYPDLNYSLLPKMTCDAKTRSPRKDLSIETRMGPLWYIESSHLLAMSTLRFSVSADVHFLPFSNGQLCQWSQDKC